MRHKQEISLSESEICTKFATRGCIELILVNPLSGDAYKWTVKYLSKLSGTQDEVTTESVNAILDAIKSTDLYQFDGLLDVPTIKQLEKDPKYAKVHQLLTIFVVESLDTFKTFTTANPGYLKQLGTLSCS